jgi:hypothetical protein
VFGAVLTRRSDANGDRATLWDLCDGLDGLLYILGIICSLDSISCPSSEDSLLRLCNDGDWTYSEGVVSAVGPVGGEYEMVESAL